MGKASFYQASFLGGEWSKQFQGRADRDDYRTALNVCLNIIPLEEGAAARRPGTKLGGPTRSGAPGVLREFYFDEAAPFTVELTGGHLRLWQNGAGVVVNSPGSLITGIPVTYPLVLSTAAPHQLTSGDQGICTIGSTSSFATLAAILGRQLSVTVFDAYTFKVFDALTGDYIDGSLIDLTKVTSLQFFKILDIATPYKETDLQALRILQDGSGVLFLHNSYPPYQLTISLDPLLVSFSLAKFNDGPYLGPPTDGTTLTPGGLSGTITLTASSTNSINGGLGFQPSDAGRHVRLFSEPALWSAMTAYAAGTSVKSSGAYWTALVASAGVDPDTDPGTSWAAAPTAAAWTWGPIATVLSTQEVTVALTPASAQLNIAAGPLLYTVPIVTWQLGAYSETGGWPSTGAYKEGRVWLAGAIKNRFDGCVSNDFGSNGYINFAPTGLDGTVADNNGIAGTLNAQEIENFLWLLPDEQGILAGTQSGEWIITSSTNGEPLTPTSIQARETSRYGSANVPAIRVGRGTIFVERDQRKIYEYMANYFTQKYVADNMTLRAKHITFSGVAEIAYTRELTPIIWARLGNGTLVGCTYKHDDPIKPIEFYGWHRHQLGHGRSIISIQGGPAANGTTDTLAMITQAASGQCFVEFLTSLWDADDSLLTAWFADGASATAGADLLTVSGSLVLRFYGMWYDIGNTVSAWIGGLDMGDFVVATDGTIDVPVDAAGSLLTSNYLAGLTCEDNSVDVMDNH
jgi:hypothetical protein